MFLDFIQYSISYRCEGTQSETMVVDSAHGPKYGQADDECRENDGDTENYLGAEFDTLVVFGIEVPHQTCRRGKTIRFVFCHYRDICRYIY